MYRNKRAVIIGGGISGKLAARVLSEFFQEIIILERDIEQQGPLPRKGAPQGEHLHALLMAGEHGLETLFPGISEKFYSSGAVKINSTNDLAWFHHSVWKLRFDGGYSTTLQTRPHLEWHIEQYIKTITNVTIQYNQTVQNYLYDEKENQIVGVELKDGTGTGKTITADLVVDASGSSSFTNSWINKLGLHIPEQKVKIGLTYVSRFFSLPEKERDWRIKLIYPNPPHDKIGGTISSVEGNRFIVTIIGYHNEINDKEVLKNEAAFLELAKKLPKSDIYDEIKDATAISDPAIYRVPQITWKRIDKVKCLPNGLLLVGDTICRLDPVFGQGMSKAVLEALALKKVFQDSNIPLNKTIATFHKQTAKIISPIWNMVITEDFRYPETTGKRPAGLSFQQWYVKKIFLLSSENQHIYDSFIKVMNLISPVSILMKPNIIKSVLKRAFFK